VFLLAAKDKCLKRGVKEVVKAVRKNAKGIVVMAGDISPIDVLSHIPVLCEDAKVPYIFVPSKAELGLAAATKRATSCILITPPKSSADYKEYYDYCVKEIPQN
jgi:H/ACA ribonucleoprotein complex subunit 2